MTFWVLSEVRYLHANQPGAVSEPPTVKHEIGLEFMMPNSPSLGIVLAGKYYATIPTTSTNPTNLTNPTTPPTPLTPPTFSAQKKASTPQQGIEPWSPADYRMTGGNTNHYTTEDLYRSGVNAGAKPEQWLATKRDVFLGLRNRDIDTKTWPPRYRYRM